MSSLPAPLAQVMAALLGQTPSAAATGAALITPANRRNPMRTILMAMAAAGTLYYLRQVQNQGKPKKLRVKTDSVHELDKKGKNKVAVDAEFFRQLKVLLKICIPSWQSKEVGLLALHTTFLIARTWLSLIVAELDGELVRDLISANLNGFGWGLVKWFAISVPATYTNSMIRYLQSKLAISFRTRLTRYVTDLYVDRNTYYKVLHLDRRIEGPDQLITTDINRFCNAASALYSNLGKPTLDMLIFNYQLATNIGTAGTVALFFNYLLTASVMRAATPAFGRMAAEEAKLEGDFRYAHTRIITNAEEIAFYNGGDRELTILDRAYGRLMRHINNIYKIRIGYNMFEDFVIKYCWSAAGLVIAAVPVFFPEWAGSKTKQAMAAVENAKPEGDGPVVDQSTGVRTAGFITNKRLMIALADAGGRLMYSYKDLSELAGYTSRVYSLVEALEDLHGDKYRKLKSAAPVMEGETEEYNIADAKGIVGYGQELVRFNHVPIATPAGDTLLVKDLTFQISPGDHLMISGPNGSGKTSILRTLAGLWPLFRGEMDRPDKGETNIFFVPQRPYLVVGSLRDQILYPHSHEQMKAAGRTDEELDDILKKVYLSYLVDREGGYDTVKEWKDVFSGGEKQRIQLARLFYHKPRWAVLDECTSAVSPDVEALMYSKAKDMGITIISISHRPALFKYHTFLLRLGEGDHGDGWTFERISSPEDLMESYGAEMKRLESQLKDVDELKRRLIAINAELRLNQDSSGLKHARRSIVEL